MRSCPEFSSTESGWVCLFCDDHPARADMGAQPVEPAGWPPMSALSGDFSSNIYTWYVYFKKIHIQMDNEFFTDHKQEFLLLSA